MRPDLLFCPTCGAANEPAHTHCFACQQPLSEGSDPRRPHVADLLHGRYQLRTRLDSGGHSLIYRANDLLARERVVAIKQITLLGLNPEEAVEATKNFQREVHMLSLLNHPQVPRLYAHFDDQDHRYLVLDYIEGQTLKAYVAAREQQSQPLQQAEIIALILQLCSVLKYLHNRQPPIIFRDLQPDNIMRTPEGVLCLLDFGSAQHYQPGSPGAATSEQSDHMQATPQADVYGLGALLSFLLSGQDPSNQSQQAQSLGLNALPEGTRLEQLASQMCSLDPGDRPTIHKVVTTLEELSYQRLTQSVSPLWQSTLPPSPQSYPTSAANQQLQLQRLTLPSYVIRRRMLIRLGLLTVMAGTGGLVWLKSMPPHPSSTYLGHSDTIRGVAWSPDGTRIASASDDGTVQVWNAANGSPFFTYQNHPHQRASVGIRGIAWSPDGKRIASASDNKSVQVWEVANRSPVFTYQSDSESITGVTWSPDGKLLASIVGDDTIQMLNAVDGKPGLTYQGHIDAIRGVAWSPDSTRIASASADRTVQVWRATDGKLLFTYRHSPTKSFNGVAWSPAGTRVASTSDDYTVQVWDAIDGGHAFIYHGHLASASDVAWSPDGKLIASTADDGTAQVWTATNGKLVTSYSGASGLLAWSPQDQRLALVTADKVIQVWDVP